MMKSLLMRAMTAGLLVAMMGCVAKPDSAALERKEAPASGPLADAPLGSRIRKRTNIAPTGGTTREDIEQQRAQAGAQAVGAVK